MTWHCWSDGSCLHNNSGGTFIRGRGWGGWGAVVEHGSEGYTLRGSAPNVTSSRMELEGALAALESIPAGEQVTLHTDATVLLSVKDAWERAAIEKIDWYRWRDHEMWRKIAAQFDRLDVTIELVVKGEIDRVHQRCHSMANAAARALFAEWPPKMGEVKPKKVKRPRARSVLEQFELERKEYERPDFPTAQLTRKHDRSATGWQPFDVRL